MLAWFEGAPVFGKAEDSAINTYVDKHICCQQTMGAKVVENVSYQKHCHGKRCYGKSKKTCKYGFPRLPVRETMVLYPMTDKTLAKKYKKEKQRIKTKVRKHVISNLQEYCSYCHFECCAIIDTASWISRLHNLLIQI